MGALLIFTAYPQERFMPGHETDKQSVESLPSSLQVEPGLLSSPQIKRCLRERWLIECPDSADLACALETCVRSATYDMRLGDWAVRYVDGERKVFYLEEKKSNTLPLPPNSLTFVTTFESFKLPRDVIARFNLKSSWVHKGLLLGTGPIIDPEFHGKITIPIHNFSNMEVSLYFKKPLIAVEFTKTLSAEDECYVVNVNNVGDPGKYIKDAGVVESSVYSAIFKNNKIIEEAKGTIDKIRDFGVIGVICSFIAAAALIISLLNLYNGIDARIDKIITSNKNQDVKITDLENKIRLNEQRKK